MGTFLKSFDNFLDLRLTHNSYGRMVCSKIALHSDLSAQGVWFSTRDRRLEH
jgi:hypothetical protein